MRSLDLVPALIAMLLGTASLPSTPVLPAEQVRGALAASLIAPMEIDQGQMLDVRIRLRNVSATPQRVTLGVPPQEFRVKLPGGRVVWDPSAGTARPLVAQIIDLEPGGEREYHGRWDVRDNAGTPVSPGRYVVVGVLFANQPDYAGEKLDAKSVTPFTMESELVVRAAQR